MSLHELARAKDLAQNMDLRQNVLGNDFMDAMGAGITEAFRKALVQKLTDSGFPSSDAHEISSKIRLTAVIDVAVDSRALFDSGIPLTVNVPRK